jgi:protein-tyrosine phosphatase
VRGRIGQLVDSNHGTFRGWVRSALGEIEFVLGIHDARTRIEPRQVRRLVFVCLGNINRSAFGAAVATARGVRAVSIGLATSTGAPATATAARYAAGFGIDLADHAATDISDYDYEPGDLLLVMETRHARRLAERGFDPRAIALLGHWASPHRLHLHDPQTLSERYFRTCFTLIHSAAVHLVDELEAAGSPCCNGRGRVRR